MPKTTLTPEEEHAAICTGALLHEGSLDIPFIFYDEPQDLLTQMIEVFAGAVQEGKTVKEDVEVFLQRLVEWIDEDRQDLDLTPEKFTEMLGDWAGNFAAIHEALPSGKLGLYWAVTDDHDEDWFIVARSSYDAAMLHEELEGYGEGDAQARFIAAVPEGVDAQSGWPDQELIEACGGIFVRSDEPRVVKFGEELFSEGMLQSEITKIWDDQFEAAGQDRPNGTEREGSPN